MSEVKVTCLRSEGGKITVTHDGREIEDVIAFSVSSSEIGAVATIVFKVGTVDVQDRLSRIFGGVEVEGVTQPGSEIVQ